MTADLSALREELAKALAKHKFGGMDVAPNDDEFDAVDALLPVVSKALAEAWGEGVQSVLDGPIDTWGSFSPNPYIVVSDDTANGGTE